MYEHTLLRIYNIRNIFTTRVAFYFSKNCFSHEFSRNTIFTSYITSSEFRPLLIGKLTNESVPTIVARQTYAQLAVGEYPIMQISGNERRVPFAGREK